MKQEQSNSPQEILKLALVHYKVIVVIVLVCTTVGYMKTKEMRPSYRSKATLVVDTQQFVETDADESDAVRDLDILTTLVERIETTPVLEHVIEISPELQKYYDVDLNDPESLNSAARSIRGVIRADLRGDSLYIDLTANSSNRDLTYLAAKYTSIGFTNFLRLKSRSKALDGIAQLKRGQDTAQKNLQEAQDVLWNFKNDHKISNLEERKTQLDTKNNQDRDELNKEESEIAKLESDLKSMYEIGITPKTQQDSNPITLTDLELEKLVLIPSVKVNEDFINMNRQYKDAKTTMRNLEVDLLAAHPRMKEAVRDVDNIRRILIETIADIPKTLNAQIEQKREKISELRAKVKEQTDRLFEWEKYYMEQKTLEDDVEIAYAIIEKVKSDIQDVEFTTEADGTLIELVEKATQPSAINPNKKQTILMGFVAGLGLSYGFLYLIGITDKSIKSVEQAEQILQLPVLAAVPVSEPDGQQASSRLIMINSPNSTCSEAFRSLRVNIESMSRQKTNKVVLFTSSMPSEGKTFTSINYAASLAQQGHRTLLIDMDLRKPAVGPEFKLKHEHIGVTDLLESKEKLEQFPDLAIYEATEKFFVLHGGPHIDNPAEHLSGYAIEKIVEKARENFDRVVIDSAPLGPVGDTLAVARLADMLCLVVRSAKTTSKVILRIIDTLHRHGHTPAGIVLNFLQNKTGKGSYYYYYSSDKEKAYTKSGYQRKQKPQASNELAVTKKDDKKKLSEFDNTKAI